MKIPFPPFRSKPCVVSQQRSLITTLLVTALLVGPGPVSAAQRAEASSGDAYARLLQTQPPGNQAYRLGRGDTVTISVEGRPELTGKQIVGPDGDVSLPMVGTISVADKTRDEAAATIASALLKFYTHPVVAVGVDAYTSNRILLLGSVERPGVQVFDRPPTLLEVLVRGGSATRPAGMNGPGLLATSGTGSGNSGAAVAGLGGAGSSGYSSGSAGAGLSGYGSGSTVGTLPDRCIIYRGDQTAINLDLKGILASGSLLANLRLQRDDVVYIPANTDRYISVMGQVYRPGTQLLQQETTLARLVSDAGGPTVLAGKNPQVRVYEIATGKVRTIDLIDLMKGKASEIPLHSGDVVYLPMSGFNSASYTLERISPLVSIFTTAALLNQR